jgi:hypothetical protein
MHEIQCVQNDKEPSLKARDNQGFRFDLREAKASLADIGTRLPPRIEPLALAEVTALNLWLCLGLFYGRASPIYRLRSCATDEIPSLRMHSAARI